MTEPHAKSPREFFAISERPLLDLIGERAELNSENLSPAERIRLFRGLALILAPAEAEQCEITAAAIAKAESAQMILREMLNGKGSRS